MSEAHGCCLAWSAARRVRCAHPDCRRSVAYRMAAGLGHASARRDPGALLDRGDREVSDRRLYRPEGWTPCTVQIGGDLAPTGYVDRYTSSISASQHTIRVAGAEQKRGFGGSLRPGANTSAGSESKEGMQVVNGTTLDIARKLAAPYHVEAQSTAGDGITVPQFNINLGETVWEIIDRITRYSQMLVYDMPDGSIMLAAVGTEAMGSGFAIGDNVETAEVMFSMDQRYQEYEGHMISTMALGTDAGVQHAGRRRDHP